MAAINDSPASMARRQARATDAKQRESYKEAHRQKLAKQKKNRSFARKAKAAARKTILAINKDRASIKRRAQAMSITKQKEYAERIGVPLALLDEYRRLRGRKFPLNEARDILRSAHSAAFAAIEGPPPAAPNIVSPTVSTRHLGPMPAIGTEALRIWRRKAAELRV